MTRPDWSAIEARPALRDTHDPVSRYGPVVEPAPVEVVTPVKPSEALRLGRLVYPEHITGLFTDGERAACALGAMCAGWGIPLTHHIGGGNWPGVDARFGDGSTSMAVATRFDEAERLGLDGDAVVLAYLEGLGL